MTTWAYICWVFICPPNFVFFSEEIGMWNDASSSSYAQPDQTLDGNLVEDNIHHAATDIYLNL